jgi:hypothetical protein
VGSGLTLELRIEEGWLVGAVAALRSEHFVRGVSIKELAQPAGPSRNTVRRRCTHRRGRAMSARRPRPARSVKGRDSSAVKIHAAIPWLRIRELIVPLRLMAARRLSMANYLR